MYIPENVGWHLGVLVRTDDNPTLKANPMQVLRVLESDVDDEDSSMLGPLRCVSVCRQASMGTYRFSNEYIGVQNVGDNLGSADCSLLRFPTVVTLATKEITRHEVDSLEVDPVPVGLGHPQHPNILLTSSALIHSLNCFDREPVWYRMSSIPVVLERIVISVGPDIDHEEAKNIVSRFYELSDKGPVVVHQDFDFTVGFVARQSTRVNIVETFPTMQGLVNDKTIIAVLPLDGFPKHSLRLENEDSLELCPRAESASNFDLECPMDMGECIIEAVTTNNFPLQNHFVVLPRETAQQYHIQHCQNIWISPASPSQTSLLKRKQSVIHLVSGDGQGRTRTHMAIALLYEDTQQLERYIPPLQFGQRFFSASLRLAYVHPELLYYLFPETLSPSRIFKISIKVCVLAYTCTCSHTVIDLTHSSLAACSRR